MRTNRRFLKKRNKPSEEMTLQITSMADIFMILLVFLLKSFSTGISNITPSAGLTLPEAHAKDTESGAMKVEIAANFIMLDEKPIANLDHFSINPNDLENDGTIRTLNLALNQIKEKLKDKNSTKLTILADEKTPYSTLKAVMGATSRIGIGDFQLVVVQRQ